MISDDRSREWVKRLPSVLKSINNKKFRITGKEPDKVIKIKRWFIKDLLVSMKKNYHQE